MTDTSPNASRYAFLDYLRAIAAWLVAWDHLANLTPQQHGKPFAPAVFIRENVSLPLGIIQDFGWFGVAVFFVISGFIISDRARVEGPVEFVVKRLLRIYPMLIVAVLISAAFVAPRETVTAKNLLLNFTLLNYLATPQVILLGVAWTLVIEMAFYVLTAVTQFARAWPHRIAVNLAVTALAIANARSFGPHVFLATVAISYLPVLCMGQTIYWWLARKELSTVFGLGYLAAAYGVFVWGLRTIQPGFLATSNSYLISVAFAVLLFVVLMQAPLKERRLVRFLSDTSYSTYLLQGLVGIGVLNFLISRAPVWVAVLGAAASTLISAYVAFRLVEAPSQRLARRLTTPRPTPPGAAVSPALP